jgi:hypothetical protein
MVLRREARAFVSTPLPAIKLKANPEHGLNGSDGSEQLVIAVKITATCDHLR